MAGRSRRLLGWGVLLLLLTAWAVSAYLRQPKPYRLVREVPVTLLQDAPASSVLYTDAGLILRTDATHFALYGWDGRERWTVETEHADLTGWLIRGDRAEKGYCDRSGTAHFPSGLVQDYGDNGILINASPDGRYVTIAVVHQQRVHLTCWRDGHCSGECWVPFVAKEFYRRVEDLYGPLQLLVMNSGHTFFLVRQGQLSVLNGGRVIAQGTMPFGMLLSPDGTYLTAPRSQAHLSCTSGHIRMKTIPGPYHQQAWRAIGFGDNLACAHLPLLAQERYITENGGIVERNTEIGRLRYGGQSEIPPFVTPDGRTLMEYGPDGQLRVTDVTTLQSWEARSVWAYGGGVPTTDGRHILQIPGNYRTCRIPKGVGRLLEAFPPLKDEYLYAARRELVLFEKPGRLQAHLRLRSAAYSRAMGITGHFWRDYEFYGIYPSPDGRALAIFARRPGAKALMLLVFRW